MAKTLLYDRFMRASVIGHRTPVPGGSSRNTKENQVTGIDSDKPT
ncbi:MAG: hypothetical protein NXH89_18870 [Cyclobacteriaceae bacterium]|nr:hypothetical protein [Cyclobacteriaceae bacterium]